MISVPQPWLAPAPGPAPSNDSVPAGQLMEHVPVGDLAPVELYTTQPATTPGWIANANFTSGLALAYSGNFNSTKVPGLGPVVLPPPFGGALRPAGQLARWYEYMKQPVVPNGVT